MISKSLTATILKWFLGSLTAIITLWLLGSLYLSGQASSLVFNNQASWGSVPKSPSLVYNLEWNQVSVNNKTANYSIWNLSNPRSDQYLIYLHGNAGRLLNFFPYLTQSYNVISPAYPGYSESEGAPNVDNVYATALATYDWLTAKGIPENKITIFGHSMGGSPATYLAKSKPQAKQLVLVNTFSSVQSMCIRSYGPLCIFTGDIFNSERNAREVTIPVRQFAYPEDTTVPFGEGRKLFQAFKSTEKKFIELNNKGQTHSYPDFDTIVKEVAKI